MEDAQKQILKVLVARDHARQVLEVGSKFLKFDYIVWFYVVPTPNKFIECLFLALPVGQNFRVLFGIKIFSKLFEGHF